MQTNVQELLNTVRKGRIVIALVFFGLVLLGLHLVRGTFVRVPMPSLAHRPAAVVKGTLARHQRLMEDPEAVLGLEPSAGSQESPPVEAPHVTYDAQRLRDPFVGPWHVKHWATLAAQNRTREQGAPEPATPPQLVVQGVVLGGEKPRAIVNNETVGPGDTIQGAVVVRIDREGIVVTFHGQELRYATEERRAQQDHPQDQRKPWLPSPSVNGRPPL